MSLTAFVFVCGLSGRHRRGQHGTVAHREALARRRPGRDADSHLEGRLRSGTRGSHASDAEPSKASPGNWIACPGWPAAWWSRCATRSFSRPPKQFRRLGCRIVWLGCMNWLFPEERLHYRKCGPFDRHVFQSRYQQEQLTPQLRRFGFQESQGQRDPRGAGSAKSFLSALWPTARARSSPSDASAARPPTSSRPRTWAIYAKVPHPLRVRVLGWAAEVEARLGPPPRWAACFPPGRSRRRRFWPGCTRWSTPAQRPSRTGPAWDSKPWPPAWPWSPTTAAGGRR